MEEKILGFLVISCREEPRLPLIAKTLVNFPFAQRPASRLSRGFPSHSVLHFGRNDRMSGTRWRLHSEAATGLRRWLLNLQSRARVRTNAPEHA
jgi:hypothetical protein